MLSYVETKIINILKYNIDNKSIIPIEIDKLYLFSLFFSMTKPNNLKLFTLTVNTLVTSTAERESIFSAVYIIRNGIRKSLEV